MTKQIVSKVEDPQFNRAGFRVKRLYMSRKVDKEKRSTGKSQTVPDQSLTVMELYRRYRDGLPLGVRAVGEYGDEDSNDFDSPDYDQLSRSDIYDMDQEVKDRNSRYNAARKERDSAQKAAADRAQQSTTTSEPVKKKKFKAATPKEERPKSPAA